MRRNMVKGNATPEELGWTLLPPGDLQTWDGLLGWFLRYVEVTLDVSDTRYIHTWCRAGQRAWLEQQE